MEDSELIDKKIVKRDTDTTLILGSEMTLADEVSEYLRYVLQLSDAAVEKALEEFNNHADKIESNSI